jgi:hypothetical protein
MPAPVGHLSGEIRSVLRNVVLVPFADYGSRLRAAVSGVGL